MTTRLRVTQALAVLLAVLISGIGAMLPSAASAMQANGNSYVSKMTGVTIAWNSPWSYDSKDSTSDSNSEVVFLNSNGAVVLIGYLPVGIDMNQARDQILAAFQQDTESFTPLDRGSYSNVSYSLDMAAIKSDSGQNVDFGVFTLFMGNTGRGATEVYIFMAPVQLFTDEMNSAKNNITIGGAAIFEGVTPGGLQNLLDKNARSSSTNQTSNTSTTSKTTTTEKKTPTPKKTATPKPTPTEEASGGLSTDLTLGGGSSDKGNDTSTSNKSNTSSSSSSKSSSKTSSNTIDPQLKKLGVTAPGKYTSPQYGVKIGWNNTWGIALDKQKKPVVTSDTSQGIDGLMLELSSGSGFVFFSVLDASQGSPAQYEQYWNSDTYFQKNKMTNAEVIDSTSTDTDATVVIRYGSSGDMVVQVMQAHVSADGSALVISQALTPLDNSLPDFFVGMAKGLTVDGNPVMSVVDATKYVADAATK